MILTVAVCFHVGCSSLDIRRRHISLRGSQDLISDKEPAEVVVLVEDVHHSLESLKLGLVPLRLSHARSIDGGIESVQVEPDVNASIGKSLHAGVMLGFWINVVNTDRVGTQSLHEVGITCALVVVDEWIVWQELVGNTLRGRSTWSIAGGRKEFIIPLRKNWLPSLVKNLAPLVVMVGMACAMLARRPRMTRSIVRVVGLLECAVQSSVQKSVTIVAVGGMSKMEGEVRMFME
jgi:hypothetical protein